MILKPHSQTPVRSVALVITLLMLSVITFLAIAFLAMTTRDKSAVTASLDVDTARSMSDAALARAQAQIVARIMAATDPMSYDYMASHNWVQTNGYAAENYYDPTNVNYDTLTAIGGAGANPQAWAQNIGNLFWDPRPPVFVQTNGSVAQPAYDFRYWVDINRNGMFESNGTVSNLDVNGHFYPSGSPLAVSNYPGEPEWIGVLKYPETNHSQQNPFIGRYAFLVLPIGKTLDWNFIHNYAKFAGTASGGSATTPDGFIRDEGAGSWELNLAGLLNDINTNMYSPYSPLSAYNYVLNPTPPQNMPNTGYAFLDAYQFVYFRYAEGLDLSAPVPLQYPQSLLTAFGNVMPFGSTNVDEYGNYPSLVPPFDFNQYPNVLTESLTVAKTPWAGSYNTNWIYDIQDLFDPTKAGTFALRFQTNMTNLDTYDRYTMQRLLGCIGTSSSPEYGVYVYGNTNLVTAVPTAPPVLPAPFGPTLLRTKVNINYDNSAQIQAGPYNQYGMYTPMPTNPAPWTNALEFFTNAADLLLRSQVYVYTNYQLVAPGQFVQSNYLLSTFGITNIPIFSSTNPGIVYNEQVHRMLQLAANIYAAAHPNNVATPGGSYAAPPVFRPLFSMVNSTGPGGLAVSNCYITGFAQVTNDAYTQITAPEGNPLLPSFKDFTNSVIQTNDNVWGIPWVIGAVKGLPAFDQYSYMYRVFYQRALQFVRHTPYQGSTNAGDPNQAPQYTNQFYEMSVSNIFAIDAWNPSTNVFTNASASGMWILASNFTTVIITNNFGYGTNINIISPFYNSVTYLNSLNNIGSPLWQPQTFLTPLSNVLFSLPYSYFSETLQNFQPLPSPTLLSASTATATSATNSYLPVDLKQTTFKSHYWTISVTNHFYYALFDGNPQTGPATLLDFVNLGPFGSTYPITQSLQPPNATDPFSFTTLQENKNWWTIPASPGSDMGSGLPVGVSNQISASVGNTTWYRSLIGQSGGYPTNIIMFSMPTASVQTPDSAIGPYANYYMSNSIMACDPLVHYTTGDLTWPLYSLQGPTNVWSEANPFINTAMALGTGRVNARYANGTNLAYNGYYLFTDPGVTNSDAWQFPTNAFPSVGWLGRVHRGTPWQTIYLKPDDPTHGSDWSNNTVNLGPSVRMPWVNSPFTYPTNDWALIDLFTTVPNDNAARGLLSVNQTNDAAWAAVFAGVVALTSATSGTPIDPAVSVPYIMDNPSAGAYGINIVRTNQTNGYFHHIGDILQASTLTTNSPFLAGIPIANMTDEMLERIPQQTLGLLKLGAPQFVIYSWGQSLKPKTLYTGPGPSSISEICTNYEITGEYLTRTVCHLAPSPPGAADQTPKIIVDSYNIEPGN